MFKMSSFEEELLKSMESNLKSPNIVKQASTSKLAHVNNLLNKAMEIFNKAGMKSEAKSILSIINEINK